jgi:hypothetical protein
VLSAAVCKCARELISFYSLRILSLFGVLKEKHRFCRPSRGLAHGAATIVIAVLTTTPIRIVGDNFRQKPRRWEQARPRHTKVIPTTWHSITYLEIMLQQDDTGENFAAV